MTDSRIDPRRERLAAQIDQAIDGLGMYGTEQHVATLESTKVHELRRTGSSGIDHKLGTVSLIERNGVLHWVDGLGFRQRAPGMRRRRRAAAPGAKIVRQLKFERLDANSVGAALQTLDSRLNSNDGLRAWKTPKSARPAELAASGRVLLIVHGTFSKSEAIFDALATSEPGKAFFSRAQNTYDQVLSYDHPTLALPPVLNAVDLARRLAPGDATIDIICHSRGGLVVRWLVEALLANPKRVGRVVFVGAPLAGTSLAAAPRLRSGLDLLTNVADVLGKGAQAASVAVPVLTAVAGILKVFGSVTGVMAKTPLIDAAVYMVPGLAAQSMTSDNAGVMRLREGVTRAMASSYSAVSAEFRPESPGWAFWRYFQSPGERIASAAAGWVFDGPNDLVVDTKSMYELSDAVTIPSTNTLSIKGDRLHHLNYFENAEVIGFIEQALKLQ